MTVTKEQKSAAELLQSAMHKRKLSYRKVEQITGIKYKTVERYCRGLSRVREGDDSLLANELMSHTERLQFLEKCKTARAWKRNLAKAEAIRREQRDKAGRTFDCIISFPPAYFVGDEGMDIDIETLTWDQLQVVAWAHVFPKNDSQRRIITIDPEGGLLFEGKGDKNALNSYLKFCRENHLADTALLDLATQKIKDSRKLNPVTYKDGDMVLLPEFKELLKSLGDKATTKVNADLGALRTALEIARIKMEHVTDMKNDLLQAILSTLRKLPNPVSDLL